MSMSQLEFDTVNAIAAICKQVISELEPKLSELQQLYDAAGGVKETLSQEELDEIAVFSDLSKTTLDDAAYALTTTILPAITNSFPALAQVAARSRGFAPPLPVPLTPPVVMVAPAPAPVVEGV
jgi:hypothetical protein